MKISIIMPVYNSEKYLEKCLDSIANQTINIKDIELIIINDGSIDNSELVIKKYLNKLNINYIKQENHGQSYARNKGLELAKGEYITFIDSDDYIDKTMLEKLYNEAKKNNCDIVTCNLAKDRNGIITPITDNISKDPIRNYICTKVGPCNMLVKRRLLTKYKFKFPTELNKYEDIAVTPLLGLKKDIKIKHINEELYFYFDNTNSVMHSPTYNQAFDNIFISMNMLYENAKKEKNYENYKNEIEYLFIRHLIMSAGLRYIRFNDPEKKVKEIKKVMTQNFPNWKENIYFKKSSIKYKVTAFLVMNNMKLGIRILDIIRGK